jgi:hypothetical protein
MSKKAAQHVAAFLLSDGVFKIINNGINVRIVHSFLFGEMKGKNFLSYLFGLPIGLLENIP